MTWSLAGKKILVTGADGFIGSHLVEALVRDGASVRALVFYNSLNSWGWLDDVAAEVRGQFEVVAGDIRDAHFVQEIMREREIVLHLAALISIPFSYQSPGAFIDTNITGALNILQAARGCDVGRVVCTSTSEVYGTAQYVPIDEVHPLQAQSPYAASKIAADQLALSFHRSFGSPVAVLRPFNTYGPRQSARAVIPTIVAQIANGAREIELGSLHPTRDFSFVTDTVQGFLHAAVAEGAIGNVINTGSGFEISIAELVRLIAQLMSADVRVVQSKARMRPQGSEVERLCADIGEAQRVLEWRPEYSGRDGLSRGLKKTITWFSDPANLSRYKSDRYNI
jgi:dTDP-glucose 4,6-dehydratase